MTPTQTARFAIQSARVLNAFFPAVAMVGDAHIPCRFARLRKERDGIDGGFASDFSAVAIFDNGTDLKPGTEIRIGDERYRVTSTTNSALSAGRQRVELETLGAVLTR